MTRAHCALPPFLAGDGHAHIIGLQSQYRGLEGPETNKEKITRGWQPFSLVASDISPTHTGNSRRLVWTIANPTVRPSDEFRQRATALVGGYLFHCHVQEDEAARILAAVGDGAIMRATGDWPKLLSTRMRAKNKSHQEQS